MRRPTVRLTFRGAALLFTALLALPLGILRNELAAQVWGAGALFLLVYFSAAVIASAFLLRSRISEAASGLTVTAEPGPYYPGTVRGFLLCANGRTKALFRGLPGIVSRFHFSLSASGGRSFTWTSALPRKGGELRYQAEVPRRGEYSGPPGAIQLQDCFGLVLCRVDLPGEEKLAVFPDPFTENTVFSEKAPGGKLREEAERRTRSDEALEVRKYTPGDDVRRLNWKLFAHAEELMIRVGEEEPPPEETTLLLLNTSTGFRGGAEAAADSVDRMASCAARFLLGRRTLLVTPETPGPLFVDIGRHEEAYSSLARIIPGTGNRPILDRNTAERLSVSAAVIFSLPGSPVLPELIRVLSPVTAHIELILIAPKTGEAAKTAALMKARKILFISEEKNLPVQCSQRRRRIAERLRRLGEDDRNRILSQFRSVRHARVI